MRELVRTMQFSQGRKSEMRDVMGNDEQILRHESARKRKSELFVWNKLDQNFR